MKLLRSTFVVLALAFGLVLQTSAPAGATSAGAAVYVVKIRTTQGLYYPGLGPARGGGFSILPGAQGQIACVGTGVNVMKMGKPAAEVDQCTITANGTFNVPQPPGPGGISPGGNYCGRSAGSVSGAINTVAIVGGPALNTIYYDGTFSTAGSLVIIQGDAWKGAPALANATQTGSFVSVGDAVPDPGIPPSIPPATSCTMGTQTDFYIVGAAVFAVS